ncbi:MAG: hypothetical protein PHW38_05950 [Candidatus Cloacimonetes bacterium]
MAKFYHIIGLDSEYNLDYIQTGHYMGRTSDLDFKVEADKTIELDNGINEVGSEKMSLSFSLLGEINNIGILEQIKSILIVPEINLNKPNPNYFSIIEIKVPLINGRNNIKLELEEKSGEFKKHWIKLEQRYDVNHMQYRFISRGEYYNSYILVLMDNITNDGACLVTIFMDNIPEPMLGYESLDDLFIEGEIAILNLEIEHQYVFVTDSGVDKRIENNQKGLIKIDWK